MKNIRLNSIIGLNTAALAVVVFVLLTTHAVTKTRWEKGKNHWAFQKVQSPIIPSGKVIRNGDLEDWVRNPIDAYVLKELEKQKEVMDIILMVHLFVLKILVIGVEELFTI